MFPLRVALPRTEDCSSRDDELTPEREGVSVLLPLRVAVVDWRLEDVRFVEPETRLLVVELLLLRVAEGVSRLVLELLETPVERLCLLLLLLLRWVGLLLPLVSVAEVLRDSFSTCDSLLTLPREELLPLREEETPELLPLREEETPELLPLREELLLPRVAEEPEREAGLS